MKLVRQGASLFVHLDAGPKVSGHRPSVDALFDSVARSCGPRAVGVVMTGMGGDGAVSIAKMREAGAWTIAQDEKTSIVFGMPKEAVRIGGVDHVVPLPKIPYAVARLLQRGVKKVSARV